MVRRFLGAALVVSSCAALVPAVAFGSDLDALRQLSGGFAELSARVNPSVVQVFVTRFSVSPSMSASTDGLIRRERATGSGVIVDRDGYVITNAHVAAGAENVKVRFTGVPPGERGSIVPSAGPLVDARIVGIDLETDLAVLALSTDQPLPALELGDSDAVRQGQVVFAFGSPFELQNSVSMGVVSAIGRQLEPEAPMVYIQTDATINPGNSGGPLVDADGKVIGINTLIFTRSGGSEGLGFAAPANIVRAIYKQIRANGYVRRGVIGIHAQTITPLLARGLGLPVESGVIVADVRAGGPAELAGVRTGDIVLRLDGKPMENGRQLDVNIYRRMVGQSVSLDLLRAGDRLTLSVPVVEREEQMGRIAQLARPDDHLVRQLGIFALSLDNSLRGLLPGLREPTGVVVAMASADTPFGVGRLESGDVIHLVNGVRVTSVEELRTQLAALGSGQALALQIERNGRFEYLAFQVD